VGFKRKMRRSSLYSLCQRIEEMVADKGYHSGAVVVNLQSAEVRTYIPEKKQRGQRHWEGKAEEQQAVYANRRRVKGAYGQRLLRKRGELMLYVLGGAMAGLSEDKNLILSSTGFIAAIFAKNCFGPPALTSSSKL